MAHKVNDIGKVKDTIYWTQEIQYRQYRVYDSCILASPPPAPQPGRHPTGSHPGMSGLPMPEEQDKDTKSTSKSLNDIEELCDVFEGSMKIDVIKFQQHGNVSISKRKDKLFYHFHPV